MIGSFEISLHFADSGNVRATIKGNGDFSGYENDLRIIGGKLYDSTDENNPIVIDGKHPLKTMLSYTDNLFRLAKADIHRLYANP
jgi:hypothetical protein